MDNEAQRFPEAFLRIYGSARERALDERELEQQGYSVWSGLSMGAVHRAVYVIRERLRERSLHWYFGPVFDDVRAIIDRYDPCELLFPARRGTVYQTEISRILLRLEAARSEADATESARDELALSCGEPQIAHDDNVERYEDMILPEDVYYFEESKRTSLILTHEKTKSGQRFCLAAQPSPADRHE